MARNAKQNRRVFVSLYTVAKLFDAKVVKKLAHCLDKPFIHITKCDSVEKAKKPFSVELATTLYDEDSTLFLVGSESEFQFYGQGIGRGLAKWRLYFDAGTDVERWVDVVKTVVEELPVLFGYMCPDDEYDIKHRQLDDPRGISNQEFEEYLPGVYWLTLFGKELTDYVGLKSLQAVKDTSTTKLAGGQTMLRLDGDLFLADYKTRIAESHKLGEKIRPGLFFEPSKKRGYKQAPQLLAALRKAAS